MIRLKSSLGFSLHFDYAELVTLNDNLEDIPIPLIFFEIQNNYDLIISDINQAACDLFGYL
jgi:hypothetical protein